MMAARIARAERRPGWFPGGRTAAGRRRTRPLPETRSGRPQRWPDSRPRTCPCRSGTILSPRAPRARCGAAEEDHSQLDAARNPGDQVTQGHPNPQHRQQDAAVLLRNAEVVGGEEVDIDLEQPGQRPGQGAADRRQKQGADARPTGFPIRPGPQRVPTAEQRGDRLKGSESESWRPVPTSEVPRSTDAEIHQCCVPSGPVDAIKASAARSLFPLIPRMGGHARPRPEWRPARGSAPGPAPGIEPYFEAARTAPPGPP